LDAALFDPSFGKDGGKNAKWHGFIRKTKLVNSPEFFEEGMDAVKLFLEPPAASIIGQRGFNNNWIAPGP
jgi:hypothetical protein